MSVGTGDFKELLYACRDGDFGMVQYFVKRNADLNFLHAEFLFAPLHESIRHGHYDISQYLLEHGADPHLKEGYTADTPLSIAQANEDTRMIALLRKYGVVEAGVFGRIWQQLCQRVIRLVQI